MRPRTTVALVGIALLAAGLIVSGIGIGSTGGSLSEAWVSETPRDNQLNHHAVGVSLGGDAVVIPVAEVPYSDVEITNTSCALVSVQPDTGSTRWRDGMPAGDCFTHALTEPVIEDIDTDGTLEVVVATTEEAVHVHNASTGREEFRVSLPSYGYGRPTVADIRPPAGQEMLASDIEGNVVAATANGTVLWRVSLTTVLGEDGSAYDAPVVSDVDADGTREIVVGTTEGFAVLSTNGSVEDTTRVAATDIVVNEGDADQAAAIIVAASGHVNTFDGKTGSLDWARSFSGANRIRHTASPDGETVRLYVGRVNGEVLALDAQTGDTAWSTTVATGDDATLPPPTVADVTGDGAAEVIAVSNTGRVAVLATGSGAELARYERAVPIWTFATAGSIDTDPQAEILVRYGDGRVVALEYAT